MGRFLAVDFDRLKPVTCPCGEARRAFVDLPEAPLSVHRTRIQGAAQAHYHRRLTETYFVIECQEGSYLELDGQRVELRPGLVILIPPGVIHRAVGSMTILNIVVPKFDPTDEVVVSSE